MTALGLPIVLLLLMLVLQHVERLLEQGPPDDLDPAPDPAQAP